MTFGLLIQCSLHPRKAPLSNELLIFRTSSLSHTLFLVTDFKIQLERLLIFSPSQLMG